MFASLGRLPVCAPRRLLRQPALACSTSVRAMASSTRVLRTLRNRHTGATIASPTSEGAKQTDASLSPTPGAGGTVSIGQRLYSLTQCHLKIQVNPACDHVESDRLSTEAWNLLQSISEEELEALPLRDVVEIVVAYNYFSSVWANGLNGPARPVRHGKSSGKSSTPSSPLSADEQPPAYPIVERPDVAVGRGVTTLNTTAGAPLLADRNVPVKRASPLDEVLDF
ncbi:hypothetical protein LSCM1_03826 [Leishmania martiniquensis]|uniref:RNA-editing substrate-binding complex 7 protein domain-containing protein n=1 Tax=Leishmania martiniquensis TaxID=1580590 RepID=A0A836GR35_9TRYP|nr:hypothetical protein LSCM1_03826 [Leishmania martiniquensis]